MSEKHITISFMPKFDFTLANLLKMGMVLVGFGFLSICGILVVAFTV